jgi:hypothetical protein
MGKKDGEDRKLLNSWGLLGPRSTMLAAVLAALLLVIQIWN